MSICQYSKPLKRLGGGQKEDLIWRKLLKQDAARGEVANV